MAVFGPRRIPVWLFAVLGVVVVTGFGVMTFSVWRNDNALSERGEQAVARVVEVSSGRNSRVHVEFRTGDGRQVRSMIGQGDEAPGPRATVGEEIPIVYDPRAPTDDVRDARAPDNHTVAYLLLAVTVFGAIAVPSAIVFARRARRRAAGATTGRRPR